MNEKNKCPLCGREYNDYPAISRTKGQESICPNCGQKQAITQFYMHTANNYQTRGINEFTSEKRALQFVLKCFDRHMNFDWGEMDEEDLHTNDVATVSGDRIFSSYKIPEDLVSLAEDSKIWIITEADRSSTTILFPSEY